MKSTLKWFLTAYALVMLAPDMAWARKSGKPSCDQMLDGIQCAASPGTYNFTNYRGGSGKYSGGDEFNDVLQLLGTACQVGGLGLTAASFAGGAAAAAATGPAGWIVGGICLGQALLGLGAPPPPPLVVNAPSVTKVVNIRFDDPQVQEFLKQHPEVFQNVPKPQEPAPKGTDVPMVQVPPSLQKKAAEAASPAQVPQKETAAPTQAKKQETAPRAEKPSSAPPKASSKPLSRQEANSLDGIKIINAGAVKP